MMLTVLTLTLAAAPPLEVRVLERDLPTKVQLSAQKFSCDGKPLEGKVVEALAHIHEVKVGEALCGQLIAHGSEGVGVSFGEVNRRYRGELRVTLENSSLKLINVVDVEDYLPSVVKAEADGAKPSALEAQAVVSRTFAVTGRRRHERSGYHLCDLTHCQLYRGSAEASPEAEAAVKKTANQVLLIGGIVLKPAFFHSSCGGHTSTATDVFGEDGAGTAVSDVEKGANAPRCANPDLGWTFEMEKMDFARAMNVPATGKALEPLRRDKAGRVLEVRVFGKRMTSGEFMSRAGKVLGWQAIRSMKFGVSETDTLLKLDGTGLGHGTGLCQLGARALAEKGVDAKGILSRYFPESQIKPLP